MQDRFDVRDWCAVRPHHRPGSGHPAAATLASSNCCSTDSTGSVVQIGSAVPDFASFRMPRVCDVCGDGVLRLRPVVEVGLVLFPSVFFACFSVVIFG